MLRRGGGRPLVTTLRASKTACLGGIESIDSSNFEGLTMTLFSGCGRSIPRWRHRLWIALMLCGFSLVRQGVVHAVVQLLDKDGFGGGGSGGVSMANLHVIAIGIDQYDYAPGSRRRRSCAADA